MAKQTRPRQRTDEETPSSSSTAPGTNSKPPQTISELANQILTALDGIYTEEAGPKRSVQVQTAVLLSIRGQVQKIVETASDQPTNADLLTAINSIRGKVEVRTDEIDRKSTRLN